jgi:hypothetical protein
MDGFLHVGILHLFRSIPMFYLTVVLEKRNIIDRGLGSEKQSKLVVQLDGNGPMVCLIRVPSMRMLKRLPMSSW